LSWRRDVEEPLTVGPGRLQADRALASRDAAALVAAEALGYVVVDAQDAAARLALACGAIERCRGLLAFIGGLL